ncbi:MAG: dienelactone hydrolase family protein [Acidiferrobacterales bacterium]|nr:dienelactone hydrolase family protein [Acidiferrobacterales bacterium]
MCEITGCGEHQNLPPIEVSQEERRLFLKGLATLPLATVLAIPELTHAAADSLSDVSITTAGGKKVNAAIAMPAAEKAPAVLLIHDWWGLNDQIKSVAAELANQGYVALAVDLYDGKVATSPDDARSFMQQVDGDMATDTLTSWIDFLKNHAATNGKVGTIGWCFGGGWSLNASIASPVDATVIYYGNVKKTPEDLASLNSPVLGHFATKDGWINQPMVDGFIDSMSTAGKAEALSVHWYDSDHAFANPTSARYDAEDAALAWERTTTFFKTHLG